MFQYIKEVIINSMTVEQDGNGTTLMTQKVVGTPGLLSILRAGEYKFENLLDGRIYKTPGVAGQVGSVTLDMVSGATTIFPTVPGIYRLSIFLGMNNQFLSDFALANWYPFGKPIIVEFEVTAANNNGAALAALIAGAINTAVPYNNVFARASVDGTTVKVSLTNPMANVRGATIEWYNPVGCDSCVGDYEPIAVVPTIVANVEPFATAAWIQENLRFPTLPNLRYNALYKDEYPIPGQMYTQYSFGYDVQRHLGGLSVVSQKNSSLTRHVYYVLNSIVDEFEQAVEDAFGPNVIVENNSVMILSAPTVANDGVPVQLVADIYPADSTVTISFAGTGLPAGVTLTVDGILTADPTAVVGSTFEVTATASDPKYKPVTRTFTVIAG